MKVESVKNVVEYYAGEWYQMYVSWWPKVTFLLGGRKTKAKYTPTNVKGVLEVYNENRPLGLKQSIKGWARQSPTSPGVFDVSLGVAAAARKPKDASFRDPGNYWIILLGPVQNGKYEYAVVSNSKGSSLYILARDPERFKQKYDTDVLKHVKKMGFTTFFNKPRKTPN